MGRDRHSCVLAALFGYRALWVHFGFAFLCGNPGRVTTGVGYAKKSAVTGRSFCNDAVLSRRFASVSCLAYVSIGVFCVRFTPAVCRRAPNRTACDALRFYSAGRDRHLCVLAALAWLSALAGSLRVCTFLYGDLDGLPGRGERDTGLAARPLCVFAQAHWH